MVSGGHTGLVRVAKVGSYKLLGQTLDDAAGEAEVDLRHALRPGGVGRTERLLAAGEEEDARREPVEAVDVVARDVDTLKTGDRVNVLAAREEQKVSLLGETAPAARD